MHDAALVVAIVNDILMTIYNDSVNLATAAGSHLILSFDTAPYEEQDSEKQNNFSHFSSNLFGSYSFFLLYLQRERRSNLQRPCLIPAKLIAWLFYVYYSWN